MSRINQKRLNLGFAIPLASIGTATAIGKPLINPGVSWIVMGLISLTWLIVGIVLFRREPPQ